MSLRPQLVPPSPWTLDTPHGHGVVPLLGITAPDSEARVSICAWPDLGACPGLGGVGRLRAGSAQGTSAEPQEVGDFPDAPPDLGELIWRETLPL